MRLLERFLALSLIALCSMGLVFTSYSYKVTGGVTARTDPARWVDNYMMAGDAGIDCTGATDVGTAFQTAIDAMPEHGTIKFPVGCIMKLGTGKTTGQCALTITDRVGVQF